MNRGRRRRLAALLRSSIAAGPGSGADDATGPLLDEATLRQLMRLQMDSRRSFTDLLAGEHVGRRKTQALEFEDYRGYVPGDDFRLIDWNAYARLGDLFVKTSPAEETLSLSLLLDCSRSMEGITLRYAKRVAALLGALALLHGDRVRVFGLGDGTALPGAPLYGSSDLARLTGDLERLPVLQATDLHGSVAAFQQLAEPYGVVVLLSDLLAPIEHIESLGFLALQGRAVVAAHIIDPAEAAPSLHGRIELRDRETGAISLLSITPAVREDYSRRFQERTATIRARLAAANILYIAAPTEIAPLDFVASRLRQDAVVAQA